MFVAGKWDVELGVDRRAHRARRQSHDRHQAFNVATHTAGTFTATGDAHPTGLLVSGNINWAGSGSNGAVNVQLNHYPRSGT